MPIKQKPREVQRTITRRGFWLKVPEMVVCDPLMNPVRLWVLMHLMIEAARTGSAKLNRLDTQRALARATGTAADQAMHGIYLTSTEIYRTVHDLRKSKFVQGRVRDGLSLCCYTPPACINAPTRLDQTRPDQTIQDKTTTPERRGSDLDKSSTAVRHDTPEGIALRKQTINWTPTPKYAGAIIRKATYTAVAHAIDMQGSRIKGVFRSPWAVLSQRLKKDYDPSKGAVAQAKELIQSEEASLPKQIADLADQLGKDRKIDD